MCCYRRYSAGCPSICLHQIPTRAFSLAPTLPCVDARVKEPARTPFPRPLRSNRLSCFRAHHCEACRFIVKGSGPGDTPSTRPDCFAVWINRHEFSFHGGLGPPTCRGKEFALRTI